MVGVAEGQHLAALGIVNHCALDGLAEMEDALGGVGIQHDSCLALTLVDAQENGEVEHHGAVAAVLGLEGLGVDAAGGVFLSVPIKWRMGVDSLDGIGDAGMDGEVHGGGAVAAVLVDQQRRGVVPAEAVALAPENEGIASGRIGADEG